MKSYALLIRYALVLEESTFFKVAILPKLTYTFNKTPIKIPTGFLIEIDKLFLKSTWK